MMGTRRHWMDTGKESIHNWHNVSRNRKIVGLLGRCYVSFMQWVSLHFFSTPYSF